MLSRLFLLTSAAAIVTSTAHALPQAGAARVQARTKCVGCTSARDSVTREHQESLLLRIDSLKWVIDNRRMSSAERERVAQEIEATIFALASSLENEERVRGGQTRVTVEAGPSRRGVGAGALGGRVSVEGGAGAQRMAAVAVEPFRPRGYLGLTFDGPHAEGVRNGELLIRFFERPRIALVEASSPGERAGILEGDTLLALNGTDVRNEVFSLTRLLVPDNRIVLRVRREGDEKELRVTVREAPDYYVRRSTPVAPLPPTPAVAATTVPSRPSDVEMAPRAVIVTPSPRSPTATTNTWVFSSGIAGARVETIDEGLGKALGTKEGVLVLQAAPGTVAYRSGLRGGDIIVRAGGRSVATVRGLRGIIADAEAVGEDVQLTIVRERKRREVTLRW